MTARMRGGLAPQSDRTADALAWDRLFGGYARSGVVEVDLQPGQPPLNLADSVEVIDFRAGSHARIRERIASAPRPMTNAERLAVESYLQGVPDAYIRKVAP